MREQGEIAHQNRFAALCHPAQRLDGGVDARSEGFRDLPDWRAVRLVSEESAMRGFSWRLMLLSSRL
jgi:ribosomal protein L15E